MEATKEQTGGLLDDIMPPRLEDAGLEDCALSPGSIKEAFFKAASSVKSRAISFFHEEEDGDAAPGKQCVHDPWPRDKGATDVVVGLGEFPDTPGPCGVVKVGEVGKDGRDKLVVVGGDDDVAGGDRLVVGGDDNVAEGEKGGGCVGGEKATIGGTEEKKEDCGSDEKPCLVEGFA